MVKSEDIRTDHVLAVLSQLRPVLSEGVLNRS